MREIPHVAMSYNSLKTDHSQLRGPALVLALVTSMVVSHGIICHNLQR